MDRSLVKSLDSVLPEEQPGSLTNDSFKKAPDCNGQRISQLIRDGKASNKEGDNCPSPALLEVNACGNCFPMPAAADFNKSRQVRQTH